MRWREKLSTPQPWKKEPKNPEAYKAAFEWLQENDPLDILDQMQGGYEAEEIAREFSQVYFDHTNPKDYPGYYSPLKWGIRAAFIYGYMIGGKIHETEQRRSTCH